VRAAVIGIGSNSVRLLVADCQEEEESCSTVLRDRRGTRLFAGLENGVLDRQRMEDTCAAVREMVLRAHALGAAQVHAFATSAARDAENGHVLREMLRERTGIELHICTGEEEARLSYAGAARPGLCGLIDIGGGSTEWIIGRDGVVLAAVSLQMGAVRLQRAADIACAQDLRAATAHAEAVLSLGLAALAVAPRPPLWIGVGGTFTALGAMDMRPQTADWPLAEGRALCEERVRHWAGTLAGMSAEARRALPGLHPERADIIVHGAAILLACFRLLGFGAITVSEHGNLDGYLRARLSSL